MNRSAETAPCRIVVLASGRGTNAQALIDACSDRSGSGIDAAAVVAVVSDQPNAAVLERATRAGVAAAPLLRTPGEERREYDRRLVALVGSLQPDLVVLAGWMRILTMEFLGAVGVPVVNLHPALPGELPGTNAIERAFEERSGGRTESGVMVHLVPDEGVDTGPVLATARVQILDGDTLETFAERMHAAEHRLLVDTVRDLVRERTAV